MKKTVTLLLALVFSLSACAPQADEPINSDPSNPNGSHPNPTVQSDYAPLTSDTSLTRGNVYLDSKELLTLESFPLQFMLHLSGNLPTPCNQLRAAISPPDAEKKILVDVYSVSDPDKMCTQVLAPFDVNIPLGSFPSGVYVLLVNGEIVAEFQS